MCSGLENYAQLKSADRQNKWFSSRSMRKINEICTSHFATSHNTNEIRTSPPNKPLHCRYYSLEAHGSRNMSLQSAPRASKALQERPERSTSSQGVPGASRAFQEPPGHSTSLQSAPGASRALHKPPKRSQTLQRAPRASCLILIPNLQIAAHQFGLGG